MTSQRCPIVSKMASTLLSLGLFAASIGVSASVVLPVLGQEGRSFSAEKETALKEAARLNQQVGQLYQQGKFNEAIPLAEQALSIHKRILGENHPDVAASLNNLALLYQNQGRYAEAEPLFKQSLELNKRLLGENHPDVATGLNNLAGLYQNQGRYAEAEPLFKQSLELNKRLLGENHPDVATGLNNLAGLYQNQGRYGEAELLYKQSLKLRKRLLGENHSLVSTSLNSMALLYWSQGNAGDATDLFTQGLQIEERNLDISLTVGAEAQKKSYLATIAGTTDATISLHLQSANNNPNAARLALTTLLRRKGRILNALTDGTQRLRQNLTPADQKRFDDLAAVRTQLATLYYSGLGKLTPEQYKDRITQLQQQATQLEADLNNRSAEFRTQSQPITLEAIQKQIPADTALVDLIRYQPFNPKAKQSEQWGKPRYAAYTLTPQGTIQAIDLGEADAIDQLVAKFRRLLQSSNIDPKPVARQLDALLMQPIRTKLGNTRQLLISPDSQLNLIPFAALVDEQNRYLVESYAITYLTTGRDLLRLQTHSPSRQPPIIVANPDYDRPGDPNSTAQLRSSNSPIVAQKSIQPISPSQRRSGQRSTDLATLKFDSLPGTAAEAKAISPKLPDAIVLTGSQATENALQQIQSPRILHIATHGFFLQDFPSLTPNKTRASALPLFEGTSTAPAIGLGENPLLRAGLALAGFNPRKSGTEDGILTALEVSNLNLRGTQLVVLSACETGLGDIANGESVYGLRRALTLAGAETQLISLWKVSDDGTKDLMVKYYDRLLNGTGRSDALLLTQREFLNDSQYRHPYYWASFIPSRDWRPLNLTMGLG
ncbi:CHAT domain-containing protein [Phormidesmis priestleyi]|nr:CHAT domain-containing tetratricopeptide repeat protein [Phormidesmis priestleyi]